MYVSIDLVEKSSNVSFCKYKNKIADKQQEAGNFQKEYLSMTIWRTKTSRSSANEKIRHENQCIRKMPSAYRWNFLDTFVFRNAEINEVNVVYKRKNNTYGLDRAEC